MATEKTSLLHNSFILSEKAKIVVVTIPKQITDYEEDTSNGLTRDQLLLYVNDPFWCALRKTLLIVFWVTLFAMFTSAVIIASVQHNGLCMPKLKMINLKGIQSTQFQALNSLSLMDESNVTYNSLATLTLENF